MQPTSCMWGAMDEVFRALADPARRALLDRLHAEGGQNLTALCAGMGMARQSVSKHLAVLEGAGLVTTVRRGREKVHYLDVGPLDAVADRWIGRYVRARTDAVAALRTTLEETVPDEPAEFAYTTYVHTTPERLWDALTDPAFTQRYWGVELVTDWRVGSPITWRERGAESVDPEQVVLEADRPRRLAYTWHTFTAEWARANGIDAATHEALRAERRSHVAFDIAPTEQGPVRLTVVHTFPDRDSTARAMCSEGWPMLLAELKTLLEAAVGSPA